MAVNLRKPAHLDAHQTRSAWVLVTDDGGEAVVTLHATGKACMS